jgi:cytoskeletal protein RodZ
MSDQFAPDEFDRLDLTTGRRGAHRAKPTPLVAALPVLLVLVVVVAVVLGVTTLIGGRDPKSAAIAGFETPTATDTPAPTRTGEPKSSASGSPSDTASAEPSGEPTDQASDSPSSDSTGSQVQQDAPVVVLNGTKTSGLAAKAAQSLRADGWTIARTDNYRDGQIPTTVFYATPDLEATAEKIARQLGGVHVQENAAIGDSITVVLGNDYSG